VQQIPGRQSNFHLVTLAKPKLRPHRHFYLSNSAGTTENPRATAFAGRTSRTGYSDINLDDRSITVGLGYQ
jgi:hypothetical protein